MFKKQFPPLSTSPLYILSPGRIVHPEKSNRKRKRSHSAYICRICPICRIRHEFDSKAKEATTINLKLRYIEVNIYLIRGHNPRNEKPRALLCTKSFPSFISPRASWQKKAKKILLTTTIVIIIIIINVPFFSLLRTKRKENAFLRKIHHTKTRSH